MVIAAVGILAACDALSPDTYWSSGDYELIAIDVKGQMTLAVDLHNNGSIGIVGPTVFALGADDHYIVVKQHPARDGCGHFDQAVVNYFIVTRSPGTAEEKEKGVRGPLSKVEYDGIAMSKSLPRFTKTFSDLERIPGIEPPSATAGWGQSPFQSDRHRADVLPIGHQDDWHWSCYKGFWTQELLYSLST